MPKGAKVVAKCSGLRLADGQGQALRPRLAVQARRARAWRAGTKIEIRVTLGKSGTGTYVYGATGSYFAWPVRAGGLGARVTRCLNVKSSKIERCK